MTHEKCQMINGKWSRSLSLTQVHQPALQRGGGGLGAVGHPSLLRMLLI